MLDVNTRIQILEELSHLAGARKHQFAAFCRQERCLVVWADEVETIIPSAEALEQRMMAYVWQNRHDELAVLEAEAAEDEEGWIDQDAEKERQLLTDMDDEGKIGAEPGSWEMRDKRPVMLYAPLVSGLAIILTCLFIGSGMSRSTLIQTMWIQLMNQDNSSEKYSWTEVTLDWPSSLHLPSVFCSQSSSPSVYAETYGRCLAP